MNWYVVETVLFWFEVPVNDAQTMQVIQGQGQLCKVELHILLGEHDLQHRKSSGCHEESFKKGSSSIKVVANTNMND